MGIQQLNTLIDIGALRFTGKTKPELLWQANFIQKKSNDNPISQSLFAIKPVEYKMPVLNQHAMDDAMDELELLGFSIGNPFTLVRKHAGDLPVAALQQHLGRQVTVLGYYITMKPVRTIKGESMFFGTFIDAAGNWLDSVHFPASARRYPLHGRGYYRMTGVVIEEFGAFALNVTMWKRWALSPWRNTMGRSVWQECFSI
jgi:error-prone DNA polymerase